MSKGGWQKGKVTGEGEILTHEETLQLLSEMAQNGSVTAAAALARELRLDPGEEKTSWTTSLTVSCAGMTGRRRRSVYETHELDWLDRLRRRFGREERPAPLFDPPRLVVERGRPAGYQCEMARSSAFPAAVQPTPTCGRRNGGAARTTTGGFEFGGSGGVSGEAGARARVGLPSPRPPPLMGLSLPLPPPHLAAFP